MRKNSRSNLLYAGCSKSHILDFVKCIQASNIYFVFFFISKECVRYFLRLVCIKILILCLNGRYNRIISNRENSLSPPNRSKVSDWSAQNAREIYVASPAGTSALITECITYHWEIGRDIQTGLVGVRVHSSILRPCSTFVRDRSRWQIARNR